jgi:acyl-CoA reductase-like NAD-dependent aldehyde dehydrogenase
MAGTPSREYKYILVREDHPAYRDWEAAIRAAKKEWAAQSAAERATYVLARAERLLEPDYGIDAHVERLDE